MRRVGVENLMWKKEKKLIAGLRSSNTNEGQSSGGIQQAA